MSLHRTNGLHKIHLHLRVYTLKKKYRRSENLSRHRGQTSDTGQKRFVHRKRSPGRNRHAMAPEQATICLDISSHASKLARPAPLTATIPKGPSKSKAVTSDKMDSGKTTPRQHISTSVFWRRGETFGKRRDSSVEPWRKHHSYSPPISRCKEGILKNEASMSKQTEACKKWLDSCEIALAT